MKKILLVLTGTIFSYYIGKVVINFFGGSDMPLKCLLYTFFGASTIVVAIVILLLLLGAMNTLDDLHANWRLIRRTKKDRS